MIYVIYKSINKNVINKICASYFIRAYLLSLNIFEYDLCFYYCNTLYIILFIGFNILRLDFWNADDVLCFLI